MICKNDQNLILFNKQREMKGQTPVSRREFFKLAATSAASAAALTMPWIFSCGKPACVDNCNDYYKRELGKDTRAQIEDNPTVELDDYSGPFRSNLRYTDFSRKQLSWMVIMAHHYHYDIQKAYRAYIEKEYGYNGVLQTEKNIWEETMSPNIHEFISETMNITGKDIEAFMKHWQVELNSLPGDNYEVIFEMPAKNRGTITVNRCPLAAEYEARGQANKLKGICTNRCSNTMEKSARLYNDNIRLKVLAMPPRQSENHICCKFALYYNGESVPPESSNLLIDTTKADIRGERVVNPNIELKDYSGPFRPNLRFTDFSRQQLARLFLMNHKYDLGMIQAYETWVLMQTLDFAKKAEISVNVWSNELYKNARSIMAKYLNTTGTGIDSFLKAMQVDITAQPPNFDMMFEMPSADRGLMAFNTCYAVTQLEPLGLNDQITMLCEMDPAAIGKSTSLYSPNMKLNILAMPPRQYEDEVCCMWEFYYA